MLQQIHDEIHTLQQQQSTIENRLAMFPKEMQILDSLKRDSIELDELKVEK